MERSFRISIKVFDGKEVSWTKTNASPCSPPSTWATSTRAAEQLGYTQSGLSYVIKALEAELGFPL
ncbi:MAG: LysR family transcriptional regulator [Evtepia sp.]